MLSGLPAPAGPPAHPGASASKEEPRGPTGESRWAGVRMLRAIGGDLKRSKLVYDLELRGVGEDTRSILRSESNTFVTLSIERVPELSSSGCRATHGSGEGEHIVEFLSARDAQAYVNAAKSALAEAGGGRTSRLVPLVDLEDAAVQQYVASLLLDPAFEPFVTDLGELYSKIRRALPSAQPADPHQRRAVSNRQPQSSQWSQEQSANSSQIEFETQY